MDENRCLKEWMRIDVWKDKYHLQIQKFQESEKERKKTVYSGLETLTHLLPMYPFSAPWKYQKA